GDSSQAPSLSSLRRRAPPKGILRAADGTGEARREDAMINARDHIDHLAELDALAFVEEFGRPVEESEEDAAWVEAAWSKAVEDAGLTEPETVTLARHYRQALRREVLERLRLGS